MVTTTFTFSTNNIPGSYIGLNHEYITHLGRTCQHSNMCGLSFNQWAGFHERFQTQNKYLSDKLFDVLSNRYENANIEEFQLTRLNDSALGHALMSCEEELLKFNSTLIQQAISDACHQKMFIDFQNIRAILAAPSIYQYAVDRKLESTDQINHPLKLNVENRASPHGKRKREIEETFSFNHWPTSDKNVRHQIEALSKRIEALQLSDSDRQNQSAIALKRLETIPLNASSILNDLKAFEKKLLSPTPHFLREIREKWGKQMRNIKDLLQYLSLYPSVCKLDEKKAHQSEQQSDVKESLILYWAFYGIMPIVSLFLGFILPRIAKQANQTENLSTSIEDGSDDDSSTSEQEEVAETSFSNTRKMFEKSHASTKESKKGPLADHDHLHDPITEENLPPRTAGWTNRRMK